MARRVIFSPNEYYHVYNRGVDKRDVFLDDADYQRFQKLLYCGNATNQVHVSNKTKDFNSFFKEISRESIVEVVCYCLMPNHFHLLICEKKKSGISNFMQKIGTGYTMYFNTRYERTGSLFAGRFKAKHVSGDEYFRYLVSYIHSNPLELFPGAQQKEEVLAYRYSSYKDYVLPNLRPESVIIERKKYLPFVENTLKFEWLVKTKLNPLSSKVEP